MREVRRTMVHCDYYSSSLTTHALLDFIGSLRTLSMKAGFID
jgi:hypothetical protein